MQLWNSAKVKLRYMLLFQNCCGVSSFSANTCLSQESKGTKGSYVPFCFHQENSEQRTTGLQRFSLVLPDLNLVLLLNQHCILNRAYLRDVCQWSSSSEKQDPGQFGVKFLMISCLLSPCLSTVCVAYLVIIFCDPMCIA